MSKQLIDEVSASLFSENAVAQVWGVAAAQLDGPNPPNKMPEYSFEKYHFRPMDYWTGGFFPGSVYALLERSDKYPKHFTKKINPVRLEYAARWWLEELKKEAPRTDTHDLGFIIQPAFQREYEHSGSKEALDLLVTAANALATRFDPGVGAIRSWDTTSSKRHTFQDKDRDFLVIIDNMCNLDMLYYVAAKTGDLRLLTIATTHAETTLKNHFRDHERLVYHVVNYDKDGSVKAKFTHQGYADESTWTRGQAWCILGYAQTYGWTKLQKFLDVSIAAADLFISRLPEDGVPPWDFDAPDAATIKDASAGMIAGLGLLYIYEYTKNEKYANAGLKLVRDTIKGTYSSQDASISQDGSVKLGKRDTILIKSTTNNNPDTYEKLADHGLVYADYYFLAVGNKLLELGLA